MSLQNISTTTQTVFIIWATLVTDVFFSGDTFNVTVPPMSYSSMRHFQDDVGLEDNSTTTSKFAAPLAIVNDFSNRTEESISSVLNGYNQTSANKTTDIKNDTMVMGPIVWTTSKAGIFVANFLLQFITIFGNLMVILSVFLEKKLRTPFNYFLVNLAITDLNVGVSDLTFYIIYDVYDYFPFDYSACCYWIWNDWAMPYESVATLEIIGIDRMWSVVWPVHYRQNNSGIKSLCMIAASWIYINILWLPAYVWDRIKNGDNIRNCGWLLEKNPMSHVIYLQVVFHLFPILTLIITNFGIYFMMRKRLSQIVPKKTAIGVSESEATSIGKIDAKKNTKKSDGKGIGSNGLKNDLNEKAHMVHRDKRAFRTLFHIVIAFLLCWTPWYIYFLLAPSYGDVIPNGYFEFAYWTTYLGSAVNPFIYAASHDEYRRTFIKILTLKYFGSKN